MRESNLSEDLNEEKRKLGRGRKEKIEGGLKKRRKVNKEENGGENERREEREKEMVRRNPVLTFSNGEPLSCDLFTDIKFWFIFGEAVSRQLASSQLTILVLDWLPVFP